MSERFMNFIGGKWVPAGSGRTFRNLNPANGEVIGEFPDSDAADIGEAVAAAASAKRAWQLTPAPKRAEMLFRLGALIASRKEELARAATREMGKILVETRGDVQEGIDMAFLAAGEGRRMHGMTTPSEMPSKWAMSVRVPLGVVGVITAWNFPFAVPTWKIFPALVSGNTVVFKPSELAPETGTHLSRLIEEAGIPAGVFNLVHGDGAKAGMPLVQAAGIDLVSFTGSTAVGTWIAEECGRRGKRVSLEMGGKNAAIVMDDADLGLASEALAWSAFGTTGQRCTACSRAIVHERVHDAVLELVVQRANTLRVGDGLDPATEMGPLVSPGQLERVHGYVGLGVDEGANLVAGGTPLTDPARAGGSFYAPTVLAAVTPGMRVAQEEIFGPVLSVLRVTSLEAAIEINNHVAYGLSSSIFTADVTRAFRAMRDLDTGLVYVNHGTTGAETHLPFGGMRGTGNGHREAGHTMLDPFTEWKSIYVDFSGRVQRAQIDNV